MICQTADDAWLAGYAEPCEHGVPNPPACTRCALSAEEIARLAVLHRPYLRPAATPERRSHAA